MFHSSFAPLDRKLRKLLRVDTTRKWREKKRAELRKVDKALHDLLLGCAYTPICSHVGEMRDSVAQAKELLSQAHWGR